MGSGKIGVVDIGLGNVNSVIRALRSLNADVALVKAPEQLSDIDKIIFPGVGHFGEASKKIKESGFKQALRDAVLNQNKPILGICLGMQLLGKSSEEGEGGGLELISSEVSKIAVNDPQLVLPHIGWNDVVHSDMEMFKGIADGTSYYFVHTFRMPAEVEGCKIAICNYGESFAAAIQCDNIWGAQFHPEKSQVAGMKLLHNFINQ